jgi:putative spermidine/putrescine transport system substrate-binding protein
VRRFAALLLLGCLALGAAAEDLTVASWGGAYTRSQILGFIRDYERTRGLDLEVVDHDGDLADIRAQVRAWNVRWDVVDLELDAALRACDEGLLETFDHGSLPAGADGTPAAQDFVPGALVPCGVGNVVSALVVAWNDARGKAPTRLEDFFDLRRHPGRRGLRRTPKGTLEWALLADGVAPERVYDVLATARGQDRAFAVLDRIRPAIVWWRDGAEAVALLESGEVAMSAVFSGRIPEAVRRGAPLEILWDHQIWFLDVWVIPRHGERTALARDFVRHATSTESLANQARYIPYGPARRSATARLDADVRAALPTAPANLATALQESPRFWAEHFAPLSRRFAEWLEAETMVPRRLPR